MNPKPVSPRLLSTLLDWYRQNHRAMPWRGHPSPYAVWVSEIMLQQTQIETVKPYFARFLSSFPTVQALAKADLESVLSLWQGLGYYARARNLRRAAQTVVERHQGKLPETALDLATLPGVGDYTAAAIASICFGDRAPAVDGNVARVLARVLLLDDDFRVPAARHKLVARLQPAFNETPSPGDLNQALMELGETVCRPRNPSCEACPLSSDCAAHIHGKQDRYPKRVAAAKPPVRQAVAVLLRRSSRWLMIRRAEEGLLGGLWELPGGLILDNETAEAAAKRTIHTQTGLQIEVASTEKTIKHGFSHFTLLLQLVEAREVGGRFRTPPDAQMRWVSATTIKTLPVATAHRRALEPKPAARVRREKRSP